MKSWSGYQQLMQANRWVTQYADLLTENHITNGVYNQHPSVSQGTAFLKREEMTSSLRLIGDLHRKLRDVGRDMGAMVDREALRPETQAAILEVEASLEDYQRQTARLKAVIPAKSHYQSFVDLCILAAKESPETLREVAAAIEILQSRQKNAENAFKLACAEEAFVPMVITPPHAALNESKIRIRFPNETKNSVNPLSKLCYSGWIAEGQIDNTRRLPGILVASDSSEDVFNTIGDHVLSPLLERLGLENGNPENAAFAAALDARLQRQIGDFLRRERALLEPQLRREDKVLSDELRKFLAHCPAPASTGFAERLDSGNGAREPQAPAVLTDSAQVPSNVSGARQCPYLHSILHKAAGKSDGESRRH